ncbi:MAG: hypothetical protein ABSG93_02245 [Solirubrobacteraceae bacterium]|jgi:hypothetical protein
MAALAICALAGPAWAKSSPPKYSLSIVEGETTQPEDSVVSTSGHVEHANGSVRVSIIRNGTTVFQSSGNGGAWMSQVPQVGDVVTLESPAGTTVGSVVYDGLPSIEATVCAGSANFSGQRSAGETVEGGYFTEVAHTTPYRTEFERVGGGQAQITLLSGSTFGGSFLAPLSLGQTVYANESLETPLAGGAVFTYSSENIRPVGACPLPLAPPPPPPPPPALQGSIFKLLHTTIKSVLKVGLRDQVTINLPGTVTQDLYLEGGTLPAYAASNKSKGRHHKKPPPALLLARGSASASSPGTVTVLLKLTSKGRRELKSAGNLKVVLLTTLHSNSGATLNLERRAVSLHR